MRCQNRLVYTYSVFAFSYALLTCEQARAAVDENASSLSHIPTSSAMAEYNSTLAPFAAISFCVKYSDQCETQPNSRLKMTADLWQKINRVNASVNTRIKGVEDQGVDSWDINPSTGDCDDYTVSKRHSLIESGISASALVVAEARIPNGQNHAVLIVKTDRGDYVLDNLRGRVMPWSATGYRWVKRQSGANPRVWLALNGGKKDHSLNLATADKQTMPIEQAQRIKQQKIAVAKPQEPVSRQSFFQLDTLPLPTSSDNNSQDLNENNNPSYSKPVQTATRSRSGIAW